MSPFGERQSQRGAASLTVFRGSVTGPKGVWEQNRDLEMEADSRASGPAAVSKIIYNSDQPSGCNCSPTCSRSRVCSHSYN